MKNKIDNFLYDNLERMNYWLQFAEAKNGSLIVLDVAVITIICSLGLTGFYLIFNIIYCMSLLLSLLSFAPNSKFVNFFSKNTKKSTDNLLFWKDVSKYNIDEYMNELDNIFETKKYKYSKIQKEIICQILSNSKIANYKYSMFSISLNIAIFGILLLLIFFIIA